MQNNNLFFQSINSDINSSKDSNIDDLSKHTFSEFNPDHIEHFANESHTESLNSLNNENNMIQIKDQKTDEIYRDSLIKQLTIKFDTKITGNLTQDTIIDIFGNMQVEFMKLHNEVYPNDKITNMDFHILYTIKNIEKKFEDQSGRYNQFTIELYGKREATIFGLMIANSNYLYSGNISLTNKYGINFRTTDNSDPQSKYFFHLYEQGFTSVPTLVNDQNLQQLNKKIKYAQRNNETPLVNSTTGQDKIDIQQQIIDNKSTKEENKDTKVLFWNMKGFNNNRIFLERMQNKYSFDVVSLVETWKAADINIFKQETNNQAKKPDRDDGIYSRNSGGIQIGSTQPMCRSGNLRGFSKTKVNGIFVISVQFNVQGIQNSDNFYRQVRALIQQGRKVLVMGDFNTLKDQNVRTLTSQGMQQLLTKHTYFVENRNGTKAGYFNDQVFYFNILVELETQLDSFNGNQLNHKSDHSAIIFKIKDSASILKRQKITFPNDKTLIEKFDELQFHSKSESRQIDPLKMFYDSVYKAASNCDMIKDTSIKGKLSKTMTDIQFKKQEEMIRDAEDQRQIDRDTQHQMKEDADKFKKRCKQHLWNKHVESCVQGGKQFTLANNLLKKGKLWVDGHNINGLKAKSPVLDENKEITENKWTECQKTKFKSIDSYQELEETNNLFKSMKNQSESVKISEETLDYVISKCKSKSAPGISGISYKMIKHIQSIDKEFILKIVNDVINNKCETSIFSEMIVIPVYKINKKGNTSDPNSFRSVCLGECLYKIIEGCQIETFKKEIEDTFGNMQFAYKRNSGTTLAAKKLHDLSKNKKGYIISVDLAAAFDSTKSSVIFKTMLRKQGNKKFIHVQKEIIESLKLNLDIGFSQIKDVESKRGNPQGLKFSAQIFCTVLHDTISNVMAKQPEVDWVIQADDITLVLESTDNLENIFKDLVEALEQAGMKMDQSKTQFIRLNTDELPDTLHINGEVLKSSEQLRFLGQYIRDKSFFNLEYHITKRTQASNQFVEKGLIRFINSNFWFNVRTRRLFVVNRTMQKQQQGVNTLHQLLDPRFTEEQEFILKGQRMLDRKWTEQNRMDIINQKCIVPLLEKITRGLVIKRLIPAVLMIKPLHAIGFQLTEKHQIIDYWLKDVKGHQVEYIKNHKHIITDLLKCKVKLNNEGLLLSLLCGHQENWVKIYKDREVCYQCKQFQSINCLNDEVRSKKECCGLAIPGRIPEKEVTNSSHQDFMKFLNKISTHPMFQNQTTDRQWTMDPPCDIKIMSNPKNSPKTNENVYDQSIARIDMANKEDIICYTDGSFDPEIGAGAGVKWVHPKLQGLDDLSHMVPGRQSNIRAEMFAIYLAILQSSKQHDRKLLIRTDSKVSIDVITKSQRYQKDSGNINRQQDVCNEDLLQMILIASIGRNICLSWVKAHVNHQFNECADKLSKNQVKSLKKFLFDTQAPENINKTQQNFIKNSMTEQDSGNEELNDEQIRKMREKNRPRCPKTNKGYYKVPISCIPAGVDTEDKAMDFIDKFWQLLVHSHNMCGLPMWNHENFPHPIMIIQGIELIKGADQHNLNHIVAWNIVCLGKYDTTVIGIIIAAATQIRAFHGNTMSDRTVANEMNFSFHNWNMTSKTDDILTHFLGRLNMKQGLTNWFNGRIGRVTDKKEWKYLKFDHEKPEFREKVKKYIGKKQF